MTRLKGRPVLCQYAAVLGGARIRKCDVCQGEYDTGAHYSRLCPDCDPALAPADDVRKVILDGGEAVRLNAGLHRLEAAELFAEEPE